MASTLCKYDLRKGDLFVLSWARVRPVRRGSVSSELLMCVFLSLEVLKYVVCLCKCCMFVSCVHPVAVLNAVFCMTCSLLLLVENTRGNNME